MEGKETRFGLAASALFAVITTAASCGAVNAMHDSFSALGGMVSLVNVLSGEVIVGVVVAGLYRVLVFACGMVGLFSKSPTTAQVCPSMPRHFRSLLPR